MTQRIPILLIGYCRPIEFTRITKEIELLETRKVHISLDGPAHGMESLTSEVLELALKWQGFSRHEISINSSQENLGLFNHFRMALQSFFALNKIGLILEDDMQFQPEFIDFLDSENGQVALYNSWSVAGHNPRHPGIAEKNTNPLKIAFFETEVHTIWGWATSYRSIEFYLQFIDLHAKRINYLNKVVEAFAKRVTMDPFLRISLINNWRGKITRAVSLEKPNWDNYWVLAGWDSGEKTLMPALSLSRENPEVYGNQTHKRLTRGLGWDTRKLVDAEFFAHPMKIRNINQVKLLEVWGTSRRNSWKQFASIILHKISRAATQ